MLYEHELVREDFQLQLWFEVVDTISYYVPAHWHNHLEILFILDGSMSAYINDRKYKLRRQDMLIINPREIHSTQIQGKIRYILFQIPPEDLTRLIPYSEMLYFEEFYPADAANDASAQKAKKVLTKMKNEFDKKEDGYQLLFRSYYYEFLHELYKNHTTKLSLESMNKAAKNILRIEQIMDYVRIHYQNPITLEEISASLSLSTEYFCRLFRKYTAQTFFEYVNTVRLVHFYADLIHSNDKIADLMDKNGITNYKVFIRMFKHAYGSTPQKLRSRVTAVSNPPQAE